MSINTASNPSSASDSSAGNPGLTFPAGPLLGVKVLDISTVVAGPFASTLLADFGAEVLKVELPNVGDPIRQMPPHKEGRSLWSKVANRNKAGVTIDLRREEGRRIFERLVERYDVLVENFRPGTLEGWGLGAERLRELNPRLVVLRVTGFGQTGPYASRPGFARIFEAMSGFVNLCGEPDAAPMYPGFPISDALTGVFGAFAVTAALYRRVRHGRHEGQEIDLAATEAMFRVMDFLAIEYDQLGLVRQRQGNLNAYSAPSDRLAVTQARRIRRELRIAQQVGPVDRLGEPAEHRRRTDCQRDPFIVTGAIDRNDHARLVPCSQSR